MFRVLESHRVQLAIDGATRGTFRRELLSVPLDASAALALVRLRTIRPGHCRAPVLLVHGFGMNRHTWHLDRRSFAAFLAHRGYDVYVLELRGVGRSRHLGSHLARHLDDYILGDLPAAVDATLARSGHPRTYIVGHSMGGLVTYCAMPDLAARLAGVITLSAVYTFASESRLLHALSALGRRLHLPERFHPTPFAVRRIGQLLQDYIKLADSRASLALLPFQAWYPQAIERDLLLQQMRTGWDLSSIGILLALLRVGRSGDLVGRGGRRYLEEMTRVDVPLLVIAAERDTLLPPADARVAYDRSRANDRTLTVFGPNHGHAPFGHLDLILGRDAPRQVWPHIAAWLDARTDPPAPKP